MWNSIYNVVSTFISSLGSWFISGWSQILTNISSFFTGIVEFFADSINTTIQGCVASLLSVIDGMGTFSLEIPNYIFSVLNDLTYGVGYIVPLSVLLPIPLFFIAFYGLRILLSIVHFIKGFIPFLGG